MRVFKRQTIGLRSHHWFGSDSYLRTYPFDQEGICARAVAKLEDRHLVIVLYCLFYCFRRGSDISIRALFMNLHISGLYSSIMEKGFI
jgi:hypothetical protein